MATSELLCAAPCPGVRAGCGSALEDPVEGYQDDLQDNLHVTYKEGNRAGLVCLQRGVS